MGELRGCVQCRGLSDTLLVVSILVYDCHLWVVVQSWGVNNSSCGNYGFFLACGGRGLLGCARGRGLGVRALPSGVYPAGRLRWHFTCGFDFGHGLWLPFAGNYGFFLGYFKALGELMGCVQSRELGARTPRLPRFILLGSFSDTLLVVSILDIVYDCYL